MPSTVRATPPLQQPQRAAMWCNTDARRRPSVLLDLKGICTDGSDVNRYRMPYGS